MDRIAFTAAMPLFAIKSFLIVLLPLLLIVNTLQILFCFHIFFHRRKVHNNILLFFVWHDLFWIIHLEESIKRILIYYDVFTKKRCINFCSWHHQNPRNNDLIGCTISIEKCIQSNKEFHLTVINLFYYVV